MSTFTLNAISPIDGRYFQKTQALSKYFSENALFYYRLLVEIRWLESLANNPLITEIPAFNQSETHYLQAILDEYTEASTQEIKKLEQATKHDVKAVEYYLAEKLHTHPSLNKVVNFIHFACTSEDINNLAYAHMLKDSLDNLIA